MCMFVQHNNKSKSRKTGGNFVCDQCGKKGHTACSDGKPYCRQLIAELGRKVAKEMMGKIIVYGLNWTGINLRLIL